MLIGAVILKASLKVFVRCPSCGAAFHAATINRGTWWGKSITVEQIANQTFCRSCHHQPPLELVPSSVDTKQGSLLAL